MSENLIDSEAYCYIDDVLQRTGGGKYTVNKGMKIYSWNKRTNSITHRILKESTTDLPLHRCFVDSINPSSWTVIDHRQLLPNGSWNITAIYCDRKENVVPILSTLITQHFQTLEIGCFDFMIPKTTIRTWSGAAYSHMELVMVPIKIPSSFASYLILRDLNV